MPFNAYEFAAEIDRTNSLAHQANFEMRVMIPPALLQDPDLNAQMTALGIDAQKGRDLSVRIDSMEFPGRSITNTPYRDYGLVRNIAFESNMIPITSSVLLSSNFRERMFFNLWQDMIVGNYRFKSIGEFNTASKQFNIGYFNDYAAQVDIIQYDQGGHKTYECKLIDAYPQLVAPLSASWAADDYHRMNVTWVYRYFEDKVHAPHGVSQRVEQRMGNWLSTSGIGAGLAVGAGVAAHKFSPKVQKLAAGGIAVASQIFGLFR